ncbi:MAG TPA: hypothetical protein VKS81_06555 [Bacteroidota bacterium]|nr:hypothetical protein [Bacteroidota bacterium]
MKTKLNKEEREIERTAGSFRPVSKGTLRKIEHTLGKIRKTRNINIRISESALAELRKRSQEEGIPYQTLISSVLHKYVTNQLVDEKTIRRSLNILAPRRKKTSV